MESFVGGDDAYACPSFSSYSSDRLAEIAVKVAAESSRNDGDEDFEFALVQQDVSGDDLFSDGPIGPIFPVFNRNMLVHRDGEFNQSCESKELESSVVVPLSKLLIEEDRELDNPPSCSSSEADELENIPAGTYCVWRPKPTDQPSPSRCNKSNSTGSASKRWKFSDLLRRSNSEGKDSFVFVTPTKKTEEHSSSEAPKRAKAKIVGTSASGGSPSAHEALYIRNRAMKEGDKKKSYLPYRRDIVGFFVNINGLNRKFPARLL